MIQGQSTRLAGQRGNACIAFGTYTHVYQQDIIAKLWLDFKQIMVVVG